MSTDREKANNDHKDQSNTQMVDSNPKHIYLDFYGLNAPPFSTTPDPEFLFLSKTHNSVIEKILYGIDSRMGFILLVGEVGTGKTTICRSILDKLEQWASSVYIINPSFSGVELISGILDDLGIGYANNCTKKELIDHLNRFLLSTADTRPVVIIVDDAQSMPMETLEDLRLLSNLETDKEKLLQLILVGQPELMDYLSRSELRQLRQRVAISCFLEYLSEEEIDGYIHRRLFVAGDKGNIRFTKQAKKQIAKASRGIPRLINKICDYALTAGYIADDFTIRAKYVEMAIEEIGDLNFRGLSLFKRNPQKIFWKNHPGLLYGAIPALVLLAFLGYRFFYYPSYDSTPLAPMEQKISDSTNPVDSPEGMMSLSGQQASEAPEKNETLIHAESPAAPDSAPFSLQIGAYKYLDGAIERMSVFQKKNIEVHLSRADLGEKGILHRIFVGRFETKEQAEQFKTEHGLSESVVLSLPWTILVDQANSLDGLYQAQSVLRNHQYDCYTTGNKNNGFRLLMGVYPTEKEALAQTEEINRLGLEAKVILR